jgi:cobalamin transport system ATP-binding protein
VISFEQLTVRYGTTVALDGITGRVGDGEWLGLIGPNGAGKTTLLGAISRLLRYDGAITINGRPAAALGRRQLARLIAYVPQRPVLPPNMTVSEYVLLGRTAHIGYLRSETAADRQICGAAIDRLDLSVMSGRTLRAMSGGELQRVVLARALAQEAPVLLLDEPTSALDLGRRMDALELIDQVRREKSLTVLSAIHDLTLAGQFADRLLLLSGGQVAATGQPAEVLTDGVLSDHFGSGVQVLTTDTGDLAVIARRSPRSSTDRGSGFTAAIAAVNTLPRTGSGGAWL